MENQDQFEAKLAKIAERERRAQKRALWLTAIPIVIGLLWLLISYIGVSRFEARKKVLQSQITDLGHQLDSATKEQFPVGVQSAPLSTLNKEEILKRVSGNRRKALESAWSFYEHHPQFPFKWGGKKPEDGGFDSSGYVAYYLADAGVIVHPENYYSGALRAKFGVADASGAVELQAGDLVFEENKACWFVLDSNHILGMVPQGFVIADPTTLSSKVSYGRVPY